ncbi:hypothetical protein [Streptomyces sp. NPDC058373]|uniref:hypothetical protein n=2 Tax=Streptomyces TaxID=1883 RepID=UPI0036603744
MRTAPGIKARRNLSRGAAPFTGVALALAMVVALAPAAVAAGGAPAAAAADDTLTVDNATGLASDGKPMAGPGLYNTDVDGYYYSIGATQLDASAGGTSLALYRGKDWRNKSLLKVVADADTTYTMPDGTVTHPLANAKLERIDFERAPSGKYVVWVHWELKATYSASQTMALVADKPTGPYEVVATHARPGASLNVGGKGQAGSTDFKDAMGDRVGQLRKDYDTAGKSGAYDGSAEAPTTGSDYPPQISTFPKPTGPRGSGYDPDKPARNSDDLYGSSVQEGTWWTFNFNDLHDDMTLKASAVRMTPYDQSAYEDAEAAGINPSPGSYIVRYPAAKSDPMKAAGIAAKGYGGGADEAYDPNPDDDTTPIVDEMDRSAVASETYTSVEDDSGARKELVAPQIAPRVDENAGVNKGSKSVVANEGDRAYVTADIDVDKYQVLVTTDGSDPRTSDTAWQWDNRYKVPDISITDGLVLKAVSTDFARTRFSDVATTSFSLAKAGSEEAEDVPVFEPVMNFKSGDWHNNDAGLFGYGELRVLSPTYNAEVYYTMDGADPVPARYGQNLGFALQTEGEATEHTQAEVDKATTALTTAIKNLRGIGAEVAVDITKLAQAIENGEAKLDESHRYTKQSVKSLKSAVKAGKKDLAAADDPETTQAQINAATKAIRKAITGLAPSKATAPALNPSALRNAVEQASKVNAESYTARSWKVFESKLDNARRIATAPRTQQQVTEALDQLSLTAGELVARSR